MDMPKPIAAILVGGLGTRLRPLTHTVPKPLIKINKKPFLSYLLTHLSSLGIKEVILLTGYKAEAIHRYCGSGKRWSLKITYSHEKEPLGTGGSLLNAPLPKNKTVLLLNGDTYINLELHRFLEFHKKKKAWISLYAMEGELKERGALILSRGNRVKEFVEKQKEGFGLFNAGAYLIHPVAIRYLRSLQVSGKLPKAFSLERDGFPLLVKKKKVFAYVGRGFFLDIGSFHSLEQAKEFFKNKEAGRRAIFLDRDGVINKHRPDYVKTPEEFVFEENALEGLKILSKLSLPIFIVTNQSMIGRGITTEEMLSKIHAKMLSAFKKNKIKIKGIFVCPHKPEDDCACRKPKPGMLLDIQKKFGIDLSTSYLISDSSADVLMGNSVGCTTILINKGLKGRDGKYRSRPCFVAKDLLQAAQIIEKLEKN